MKVFEKIVESVTEPGTGVIWFKDGQLYIFSNGVWTPISGGSGNSKYQCMPIVQQTEASVTIQPDVCNVWGEVAALTVDLAAGEDGYVHEYVIWFVSGATATTLSLPTTVKFPTELTIEANTMYEISIVNGGALAIGYPIETEES